MSFTTETIDAPEFWAGYLINGTKDNLNDADIKEIDAWLEAEGLRQDNFVEASEDTFPGKFLLPIEEVSLLFTLTTYTYLKENK